MTHADKHDFHAPAAGESPLSVRGHIMPLSTDALLQAPIDTSTVRDEINTAIGKLGENIVVRRAAAVVPEEHANPAYDVLLLDSNKKQLRMFSYVHGQLAPNVGRI